MELSRLDEIRAKAEAGKRLDREDGRWLLTEAPLLEVGALAQEARFRAIPAKHVTFVIDSNPNYTNVCITDCQFCAFYRKPGHPEAWTLTVEQVLEKIEFAASKGATTVLLQGGHNPELPLDYYLTIVRESRRRFPGVTPHFFTASEIQTVAQVTAQRRVALGFQLQLGPFLHDARDGAPHSAGQRLHARRGLLVAGVDHRQLVAGTEA